MLDVQLGGDFADLLAQHGALTNETFRCCTVWVN
jgi:hypothetical protein